MEKLNMSYEELKDLFNRYSWSTLDSLDILFTFVDKYNLNNTNLAFINVFRKKYMENIDNFEGRNEYDYITRINNFDLSEITDNTNLLNKYEINYFKNISENALANIDEKDELRKKIIPSIKKLISKCSLPSLETIDDDFTKEELDSFFDKYTTLELQAFGVLLGFVNDYELANIIKSYNKVQNKKYSEFVGSFENKDVPFEFSLSMIKNKNEILDDKELELLNKLVGSASIFLDSIDQFDVENERRELYILDNSITNEIDKRNSKVQIKR